ncbi:unnamed protein product [Parnassius apollo]|uniref:(apollo) hypothetical protein n=1 Tax=Parnassius apollo TaxID=110799 RepID=A0A8S3W1Y3_PARAO|nr:unnamed protein product [Parnassius apollo]
MHRLFTELEPSITVTDKTWQTEFGISYAQIYLMAPNSNGYDVRLFPHQMKTLRLRVRCHKLQNNPHTWMPPRIPQWLLIQMMMEHSPRN